MGLTDTSKIFFKSHFCGIKPENNRNQNLMNMAGAACMEKPVVYRVAAGKMADEGYEFFLICKWSMACEGCSGRVFKQIIVIYEIKT